MGPVLLAEGSDSAPVATDPHRPAADGRAPATVPHLTGFGRGLVVVGILLVLITGASLTAPDAQAPTTTTTTTTPTSPTTDGPPPQGTPAPVDPLLAGAGSAAVGSARYAVPAGAVFVSPSGSDSAKGSASAPVASVAQAVAMARPGGTIVLRAGTYHESVTLPAGKRLTLQPYPGEAVWFDGSSAVSGWSSNGGVWVRNDWTADFDHSPTYTPGAPDNTEPGWAFINPAYPMAAYPDQVWIDGQAQRQVGSLSQVAPGTFYVNTSTQRLVLGSDPTGHQVRASTLATAFVVDSAGSTLRGFGVRRYATSMPLMGTVRISAPGVTLENLAVTDNATQGISVGATDATLRHVSALRNGLLGIHADYADGLRLIDTRASNNNTEHFNMAPVSGGFKITRSRGLLVTRSVFAANNGPGVWMDASVYNSVITGNDLLDNAGHGLSLEISAKSVIADNLVAGNGGTGLKINDSSQVEIWNNTIIDNTAQPLWLVQDSRVASDMSIFGHDNRRPLPDPTMTWILGPVTVKNNVFAQTDANCLLCVQDNALNRSAATIGVTADGNVYLRADPAEPVWLVVWPSGSNGLAGLLKFFGPRDSYSTLDAFQSATGQELHGLSIDGRSCVAASGALTCISATDLAAVQQPLDPAAAKAMAGLSLPPPSVGARR